ncbi:MATE family efflux transporter [Borrelia sp. RT5S]|uniref:MATE family efflux transporter n=1 Tax=Borrelia sp. RT5S TaxID=2898581 RepID=UPI001E39356C|nr:MATE family efflux transporter [Borrelia sp. RT5S]UGQ16153.1 MATE family efflux transporter [Borrelia sp. RT5S]
MIAKQDKTRDLVINGNIYKVIFVVGLPLVVTNIIQIFYELTDMFYVAKLGTLYVSALSLIWPINFFIVSLGMGMGIGSVSLIARSFGEGNYKKTARYSGQLLTLSFLLSILVALSAFIFIDSILDYIGASGELKDYAREYFSIAIYAIPVMFLSMAIVFILNAIGSTVISMIIILIANIVNFILDPMLIFTFDLGIAGAAWATLFSKLVTVVSYPIIAFCFNKCLKIYIKDLMPNLDYLLRMLKGGIPASLSQAMVSFSFIIFNSFIVTIGTDFLAAYGISNMIDTFLFLPAMAFSSALATIIGQNLGISKIKRASEALRKGFFVIGLISISTTLILIINRNFLISLFTGNKTVLEYANYYLFFIAIGSVGFSFQLALQGALIGAGLTNLVMVVTFTRVWLVAMPIMLIIKYFGVIFEYIWVFAAIPSYIGFFITLVIVLNGSWRHKKFY